MQDTEHVDLLSDLTEQQRRTVTYGEGPLLILAGAGSGKTRVITRRIAWLISQGVRPWNILAITFTNKAAGEMQRRVEATLPGNRVWISTFHSLGARLLRQYGERFEVERNFTIYDQSDRLRVVKAALDAADLDRVRFTPETIMHAISKAKNQLMAPPAYANQARDYFTQTVAHIYPYYEKRLRENNAFDFDDLLFWPAKMLKNDQELRVELDQRFSYILIDEYQDTNKAQYTIARALSVDYPNLCVVGDPDQSIYGWRGADIRNILDFERDFPGACTIALERNYRSTKAILRAASHVIANNRQRKHKDLTTENPDGKPVAVQTHENGVEEAESLAIHIRSAVEKGERRYRDFAIFMRVNALSRVIESAFIKNRIPYQIVRGLAFYDRKENRDVLAYLRLLVNPKDDVSFGRIVNEPVRGIGKMSQKRLRDYAAPRDMSLLTAAGDIDNISTIKGTAVKGLRKFAKIIAALQQHLEDSPDELIQRVIVETGYRQMLLDSGTEEDLDRLANVEELITAAKQFTEEEDGATIADFLETITLASDVDGWDEEQDCVSMMTLHASKGLEFPVVFITAMEQGLLPHNRAMESGKDEEIEEERRLAFVGMTRAKEELYLSHSRLREFRGQTLYAVPSMFIDELPPDGIDEQELLSSRTHHEKMMNSWRVSEPATEPGWIDAGALLEQAKAKRKEKQPEDSGADYRTGMVVRHEKYGLGKITSVGGTGALRKVKVAFPAAGDRTFLTRIAKLEIVER